MNNIHASQVSLFYSLCTGGAGVKENICNIGTVLLVTMYSESNQLQEVSDHLINNSLSTNWIESTLDRWAAGGFHSYSYNWITDTN